ncbi:MAG: hypothetical protein IJ496_03155 [Ruminococcus sp.]|nr:hypothetical protein [Ruminococcus sp.]
MRAKKLGLSALSVLTCSVLSLNITAAAAESDDVLFQGSLIGDTSISFGDLDYVTADVLSNADSGFLFYDQLDANNKLAYEAMADYALDPSETTLTVVLEDPIVLARSSRNMNNWSEEEYNEYANAMIDAVMPGTVACTLDYPEIFWLNFAEVSCGLTDSGMSYKTGSTTKYDIYITEIALTPNYDTNFTDFDQVLEIRESVLEAVDQFVIEGETDYEKCVSIYDSICDIVTYDTTAPYAHGLAGVLYDTNAVCEGYAKTFKILCDREGIPCLTILGNYDAETLTAHMWNYVYLDGAWYACDPTWDDSLSARTYFMRGSAAFNQKHTPESPYSIMEMSFPELSETDYIPSGSGETTTSSTTTTTTTTTTTEKITTTTTTTAVTTSSDTSETTAETTTTSETTSTHLTETSETTSSRPSTTTTETTTTTAGTTTETTSAATTKPEDIWGDVNEDDQFSLADAVLLRKFLVRAVEKEALNLDAADCCEDGRVNIWDAVLLIQRLLELV